MGYRFDGRVAIVTGAGRGIGRAYARLLGGLGASVVVNDLGGSTEGIGADPEPAQRVAEEIRVAGGTAIADASDVADVAGGEALVGAAVAEFGRVDIVINNAGTVRWGGLPEVELDNIEAHLAVHTKGSFNVIRAAWPHMLEQNYGRVVVTGSSGMFGLPDNLGYATAKAALLGMAKSLSVSASRHDIKINVIAPSAFTRMATRQPSGPAPVSTGARQALAPEPMGARQALAAEPMGARQALAPSNMAPELVAPMAAFLAHETCPVSGEVYLAGAGRFARVFIAANDGYLHPDGQPPTIDDVAANWERINDEAGYYVPSSLMDWAGRYLAHRS
jgi:NAD(P)-dependent dehydrogenase (short-subunit alcohol dehydrogenase family)